MTAVNPIEHPDAYQVLALEGRTWRGKIEVAGYSKLFKWEKVAGQGTDGATSKYSGEDLPDFTCRFILWEPYHFEQFESEFRPLFSGPPKGQKAKALTIDWPELVKLGIRRVTVNKVGGLEFVDDKGTYAYQVDMSLFRPKKPVQVLKASAAGGPDDPSSQLSPNQAMIRELTKQLKEEAAK